MFNYEKRELNIPEWPYGVKKTLLPAKDAYNVLRAHRFQSLYPSTIYGSTIYGIGTYGAVVDHVFFWQDYLHLAGC